MNRFKSVYLLGHCIVDRALIEYTCVSTSDLAASKAIEILLHACLRVGWLQAWDHHRCSSVSVILSVGLLLHISCHSLPLAYPFFLRVADPLDSCREEKTPIDRVSQTFVVPVGPSFGGSGAHTHICTDRNTHAHTYET